jgi:hypothetical protein
VNIPFELISLYLSFPLKSVSYAVFCAKTGLPRTQQAILPPRYFTLALPARIEQAYLVPRGVQYSVFWRFFDFFLLLPSCLLEKLNSKKNTKPNCAHLSAPNMLALPKQTADLKTN